MQKRYRITKTGKIMASKTKRRHMMTDRSPKSKRQSRGKLRVEKMHVRAIKFSMPYNQ